MGRRATDPEVPGLGREDEVDVRLHTGLRMMGVQSLLARLLPGEATVEREDDRVDHGRLARPGRAFEQEEPGGAQPVEVDGVLAIERPDGAEGQSVQLHQAIRAFLVTSS